MSSKTDNQQYVPFPFPAHLAHYLFYSLTNEVAYTDDLNQYKFRSMQIDLRSPDGKYIRSLLTRADYPGAKEMKKGFSITVRIPIRSKDYMNILDDGRYGELQIVPEAIDLINEYYEVRFRETMVHFVSGAAFGNDYKRGSLEPAIKYFMQVYHLHDAGYTMEQLKKYYNRRNSPLKKEVYAKNKKGSAINFLNKPRKTLIDSYLKK